MWYMYIYEITLYDIYLHICTNYEEIGTIYFLFPRISSAQTNIYTHVWKNYLHIYNIYV